MTKTFQFTVRLGNFPVETFPTNPNTCFVRSTRTSVHEWGPVMSTETVADEEEQHFSAPEDWPKDFGEASWWPFIGALGIVSLYVGAGLYVLSHGGNSYVPTFVSPVLFVLGTMVFLTGLYGWLYHGFVDQYWQHDGSGGTKLRWGMTLFLGTEVATFGAGFVYYFFIRVGTWPPAGGIPDVLSALVLVNTVILVASSGTLHYAHMSLLRGHRQRFIAFLGLTVFLGVVFIGGQIYEYMLFITHEGFTITSGVFGSAFFGLTGLHGLHVTLGIVLMSVLFVRALYGQFSEERDTSVTTVTMYWHFVDAVWILLVVALYAGSSLAG